METPKCILGYSAFAVEPWIIVPNKERLVLSSSKKLFNEKLSSTWVVVEQANGFGEAEKDIIHIPFIIYPLFLFSSENESTKAKNHFNEKMNECQHGKDN